MSCCALARNLKETGVTVYLLPKIVWGTQREKTTSRGEVISDAKKKKKKNIIAVMGMIINWRRDM